MKIKKSEIKTCRCAYLYHDGHVVLKHEKSDKDAGKVEWVTIYQSVGIKTSFKKPGRLIIDSAVLPFLSICSRVEVRPACDRNGSDNTKARNIAVESISFRNGIGDRPWFITNFPGLISSDIYFNDNDTKEFDPAESPYRWADYPVKSVYLDKTN